MLTNKKRKCISVISVKNDDFSFLCLFQLLNVIRENQVVVIVGETGSGKTTQLTQVYIYYVGVMCMSYLRVV